MFADWCKDKHFLRGGESNKRGRVKVGTVSRVEKENHSNFPWKTGGAGRWSEGEKKRRGNLRKRRKKVEKRGRRFGGTESILEGVGGE